jgi:D-alanine-D-alanine ligase
MSSKRILLLVHTDLVPPDNIASPPDRYKTPWLTEYDVKVTLQKLGYEVEVFGLIDDLNSLITKLNEFSPYAVFNLLEEFNYDSRSDYKVIALLDMMKIKYTGCNPKGLLLARDKALSKKVLKHHQLGTANFFAFPKSKKRKIPKNLKYPLIVKCLFEEASYGIAKASIVATEEKLKERIEYIHKKLEQDAIIEEFIEGREFYVGITGNKKLTSFPIWELQFNNVDNPQKEIYSSRAKWNKDYRERKGIDNGPAILEKLIADKIIKACKKTYQVLELSGYARIDLRLTPDNKIYILEANPNPNIAWDDEFAKSAAHSKISYPDLIESLLP